MTERWICAVGSVFGNLAPPPTPPSALRASGAPGANATCPTDARSSEAGPADEDLVPSDPLQAATVPVRNRPATMSAAVLPLIFDVHMYSSTMGSESVESSRC